MISYDQFRQTEALWTEFAQWLRSDIGIIVMRVMRDKYRALDVPSHSEALVSARVLSQFHGAHAALDDLEALGTPAVSHQMPESEFEAPLSDHASMPSPEELQTALNERHHNVG
jgi:hypothetical protein